MQKSLDKLNFRGYHSDSQSGVFSRLWQALLEKTLERLDQVNGDLLFPEGKNVLYFGDNLKRLRKIPSASVDLVYLDPPFNSKQSYNILFKDKKGRKATSQIKAFGDTWRWGEIAEETYEDVVTAGGTPAVAVKALRRMLGQSDMMAYIIMMTPRLVELRRVMKQTGSLYLHCDPTASHYLKIILDSWIQFLGLAASAPRLSGSEQALTAIPSRAERITVTSASIATRRGRQQRKRTGRKQAKALA